MSALPPKAAVRLLERVLRSDPAVRAILGDLHEDFVRNARARGVGPARREYWRDALLLAASRLFPRMRYVRPAAAPAIPGGMAIRGLLQQAGSATRAMRRSPGFVVFTATVIGLGVGAATAMYSVLKPFVFTPLPLEDPDRLVWIQNDPEPGDLSLTAVTVRAANLYDFRDRSRSLSGLTGFNAFFDHAAYTLTGAGEPARLVGADVAHDFLDVLGVSPLYGRSFRQDEGLRVGGPGAVILAHDFWVRRFGADPGVVGTRLTLDDRSRTVVGVLPSSFDFSSVFSPGVPVDFLIPFPVIADGDPGFQGNTLFLIGRLAPGATIEAADRELATIMAGLAEERPDRWGLAAELVPLEDHIAGPFRPALMTLAAAAGLLLLIVCINVSNLLLARSPERSREIAVRKALGASHGRLVGQLMFETTGIALIGAAVGGGVAWVLTGLVPRATVLRVPLLDGVGVDRHALIFAIGISILTGLVVGIVPALRVVEGKEDSALRDGARGQSASRSTQRLRDALVVAEVTLACVLLVASGLLIRSFQAVLDVELGFDHQGAVAWQLAPTAPPQTARATSDFYRGLVDRVERVPGVEAVGLIDALPLGRNRAWPYSVLGETEPEQGEDQVFPHIIDAGYLAAMGIPVIEGRGLDRQDADDTDRVVLLNETGSRRVFGTESALGRRMRFWGPWEWEVVGVVRDVRHVSPEVGPGIQVYFPVGQMTDFHTLDMVVRSGLPVAEVTSRVGGALKEIDPSMPVRETWTVDAVVDRSLSTRRFTLAVLGAFGAAALLLAGLGVYGVLAYSVARRKTEMGIRMALGASAPRVAWSVIGRTLKLAGIGVGLGAILSLATTRLLGSLLFGVGSADPIAFFGMAAVLLGVVAFAGAVPAGRAARQGPGVLRGE